jgi:hypothetical protein
MIITMKSWFSEKEAVMKILVRGNVEIPHSPQTSDSCEATQQSTNDINIPLAAIGFLKPIHWKFLSTRCSLTLLAIFSYSTVFSDGISAICSVVCYRFRVTITLRCFAQLQPFESSECFRLGVSTLLRHFLVI